jgi:hypothetical protein
MSNFKKDAKKNSGLLSIEETNAMLAQELAEEELKEQGLLPASGELKAPEVATLSNIRIRRGSSEIKCFHRTRAWVRWPTLARARRKYLSH